MSKDPNADLEVMVTRLKDGMIDILKKNSHGFLDIPPNQIEVYRREFLEIYPGRPLEKNLGGMDIFPLFWLFVVARWLNPRLIVESGVWRGQSTWMLCKACPNAKIHAFDINLKNLVYKDPTITYHEKDWTKTTIDNSKSGKGLIIFDDHINQCRRLREAYDRGFKWAIFDDNVPVTQIERVGVPALPSLGMLFDHRLTEGDIITWTLHNRKYSYTFSQKDTYNARELIDFYLVVHCYTCLTVVKLK